MNKKGQVTLFVILGLVIVIGLAFYFYIQNRSQPILNVERFTGEVGRVQAYVESCIEQVGRRGLDELGRHGGYIDPLNPEYTPFTIDYNNIDQSESDLAFLDYRNKDSGIVYWQYAKSSDDCWHCEVSSLSPPIASMEEQLGLYIDDNLQSCLDDFSSFKEQGYIINSMTNSTTDVSIVDTKILFLTNYTIEVTLNNQVTYVPLFYNEIDFPLLKYYAMAVNITQNQIDNNYLDYYAIYLVGQHASLDAAKFPPLSSYQTGYATVFWSKTNIKRNYESLLNSYMPFFRVVGTANDVSTNFTTRPIEQKMYDAMRLPLFDEKSVRDYDLKNIEITHVYAGQPIYLNVNPSDGDMLSTILERDSFGKKFSGLLSSVPPEQSYEYYYDISYPVIVMIRDNTPGKEYTFMFALQGNIKENKLLSDWLRGDGTIPWDEGYVTIYNNIPEGTQTPDLSSVSGVSGVDFNSLNNEGNIVLESYEPINSSQKILFCDVNQRISGEIKLRAYDSYTDTPLSDVRVSYNCGEYASCFIGSTVYDPIYNEAVFKSKLPICINGYLEVERDGYLKQIIPLTTEYDKSEYAGSVYMDAIVKKNLSIKKYDLSRVISNDTMIVIPSQYEFGSPINVSENDTILITFKKILNSEFEEPWTQTLVLGKDGFSKTIDEMELVQGAYGVTAQLMDYNGVVIPEKCEFICKKERNWLGKAFSSDDCKDGMYIPEDNISIDVAMWGGIEFNNTNPFIVSNEDLFTDNSIEFYVVRFPNPRCIEDMNEPSTTGKLARRYRSLLTPVFKLNNETLSNESQTT